MPGLMSIRRKYAKTKPLAGIRITGSLHMTIQTAVLIETLVDLGASVLLGQLQHLLDAGSRSSGHCGGWSTGVCVEGRIARRILVVYRSGAHPPRWTRPELIVDDGGDANIVHPQRLRVPRKRQRVGQQSASSNKEEQVIKDLLKKIHGENKTRWHNVVKDWRGVSEETTTGVHRLYKMQEAGKLLVPAINVNDSVTKSKFDNLYGCRESLADGIKRATDVMVAGKVCVICGFGDVGKGSAFAPRFGRARGDHGDRSDQRFAGGDGRLRSHHG